MATNSGFGWWPSIHDTGKGKIECGGEYLMDTFGIDPRSRVHNSRITHQNFGPTRAAVAARTKTPVVTVFASDPVSSGQIESLSHPGHNVTGVSILSASIEPKRIGLMHDLLPQATAFGALLNPKTPTLTGQIADIQTAAHALGIETRRDRRPPRTTRLT